jgi:hypothetical protein
MLQFQLVILFGLCFMLVGFVSHFWEMMRGSNGNALILAGLLPLFIFVLSTFVARELGRFGVMLYLVMALALATVVEVALCRYRRAKRQ